MEIQRRITGIDRYVNGVLFRSLFFVLIFREIGR